MTNPDGLVLMYHRINTLRPDPWDLCVSPAHFEEHLQALRTLPCPTSITFDDGYADNFANALPLLKKHDKPAIVFITSGAIDSPYEMWWDELDRKYLRETDADWTWDSPTADEGAQAYKDKYWAVRSGESVPFAERPQARPDRRMMTTEEVRELARVGLIELGAHTVTHPVLSRLSSERQRWEIGKSKADIETITGREVTSFAYPNGYKTDYSETTVALVQEAGFKRAFAAWEPVPEKPLNVWEIPRIMVRDWDGDTLLKHLYCKES